MAIGLAPRDIFRLLAGDLVGVGGAPSACCSSHPTSPPSPQAFAAGAGRSGQSVDHRVVGAIQVLRPVVGLEEALSLLSVPIPHLLEQHHRAVLKRLALGLQLHRFLPMLCHLLVV